MCYLISVEKVFFLLEIFISRESKYFLNIYIYIIIYYNKISNFHLMIEFFSKYNVKSLHFIQLQ